MDSIIGAYKTIGILPPPRDGRRIIINIFIIIKKNAYKNTTVVDAELLRWWSSVRVPFLTVKNNL